MVAKPRDKVSRHIAEAMREFESTGRIGRIRPRNKAHALEIAQTKAYNMARRKGKSMAHKGGKFQGSLEEYRRLAGRETKKPKKMKGKKQDSAKR